MVKRTDGKGHIRINGRLGTFGELSGDPNDETTDEQFAAWVVQVNERLMAVGLREVGAEAKFNGDSMREMFDAAFTLEEVVSIIVNSRP